MVRDAVVHHMIQNNHFAEEQHGFVPGRSCATQLLLVLEDWSKMLQGGTPIDTIYLDFSKAFDKIPHKRLVVKLAAYGIRDEVLGWISRFLENRHQRVTVDWVLSDLAPVKRVIPQGSVLGPLLFVIFINDLPKAVNSTVKVFADDTKIYHPIKSEDDITALQADLHKLEAWSTT